MDLYSHIFDTTEVPWADSSGQTFEWYLYTHQESQNCKLLRNTVVTIDDMRYPYQAWATRHRQWIMNERRMFFYTTRFLFPSTGLLIRLTVAEPEDYPTFSIQELQRTLDNVKPEDELSEDEEYKISGNGKIDEAGDRLYDDNEHLSMDLTENCPTVRLPFLLLSDYGLGSEDSVKMVQTYHKIQLGIYGRLPPDVREAVMHCLQLNETVDDFFKKSQWKMFLESKMRSLQVQGKQQSKKVNKKRTLPDGSGDSN